MSAALPKNNFRLPVVIALWMQWFVMYVSGQCIRGETGFRKTWKDLLPFIVTARPISPYFRPLPGIKGHKHLRYDVFVSFACYCPSVLPPTVDAKPASVVQEEQTFHCDLCSTVCEYFASFKEHMEAGHSYPEDVESPAAAYCDSAPDDRPLLDLSKEQHLHLQQGQPA